MTVRLSLQKVSKIMKRYFGGMPQSEIAKKAGVDQSTVSIYASRLKERADEIGLPAAEKEYLVFNEVDALRSLSVELSKADLTVEEAKQGINIVKAFMKLGINPDEHIPLVKICGEIGDPSFVHAAVKLSKIEAEGNMTYEEVTARFEKATSELPCTEMKLQETQARLKSAEKSLA